MLRMPYNDEAGNPVFLDIRRWIPAGDIFDMNQGSSAIPVPSWMQFGGPLMLGAELALNKSAFTGNEIVNDLTDTGGEKAAKVSDYLYKAWMPSAAWVPGSWYWDRIGTAIEGGRDWQGRPYSVAQSALSSVGLKVKPQDVDAGFQSYAIEFAKIERELRYQARNVERDLDRNLISEREADRLMDRILDKLDAATEKYSTIINGEE